MVYYTYHYQNEGQGTDMEIVSRIIPSRLANGVEMRVFPGHYATNHSHVNYYVDLTDIKVRHKIARQTAEELAVTYSSTFIDTIICLEGTELVGGFMAAALAQSSVLELNDDVDISVITPTVSTKRQFIFLDNTKQIIENKSILLLVSWASTGRTIYRAIESLKYYGGHLAGISALFSVVDEIDGYPVHAAFTLEDLPDYRSYEHGTCEMCGQGEKLSAVINSQGYFKI